MGLRETLDFLFRSRLSQDAFEAWILEKNGGAIGQDRIDRLNRALSDAGAAGEPADPHAEPALSAAELAFWDSQGYVIVRQAAPREQCEAAVRAICEFLHADLGSPETWYNTPQGHSIWVPLLHHPALEANRRAPRIHRAFAQLWGREDIWMNVDQAPGSIRPNARAGVSRVRICIGM